MQIGIRSTSKVWYGRVIDVDANFSTIAVVPANVTDPYVRCLRLSTESRECGCSWDPSTLRSGRSHSLSLFADGRTLVAGRPSAGVVPVHNTAINHWTEFQRFSGQGQYAENVSLSGVGVFLALSAIFSADHGRFQTQLPSPGSQPPPASWSIQFAISI